MSGGQDSVGRAQCARVGAAACFLLTGFVFATFASRVPAIKGNLGLTDGQLAIGFVGLNAGAILGLQLGGMLVPRTGSRPALVVGLLAFAGALLLSAVVPNLPTLVAALFLLAVFNSVVDVAMNAQGVTVQRLWGGPCFPVCTRCIVSGVSSARARAHWPRASMRILLPTSSSPPQW